MDHTTRTGMKAKQFLRELDWVILKAPFTDVIEHTTSLTGVSILPLSSVDFPGVCVRADDQRNRTSCAILGGLFLEFIHTPNYSHIDRLCC